MPKTKTSKSLTKRIKVTATGKVKARRCGHGHLLSGKSAKQRRHLRGTTILSGGKTKRIKERLGKL